MPQRKPKRCPECGCVCSRGARYWTCSLRCGWTDPARKGRRTCSERIRLEEGSNRCGRSLSVGPEGQVTCPTHGIQGSV